MIFLFAYMYATITDENVKPIGVSQPNAFYHTKPDVVASANTKQQAATYMKKIVEFNNWGRTVPDYLVKITGMTVSGYAKSVDGVFIKHTNNAYGLTLQTFLVGNNLTPRQVLDGLDYFWNLYMKKFRPLVPIVTDPPPEKNEKSASKEEMSKVEIALNVFENDMQAQAISVNTLGWSTDELAEAKILVGRHFGKRWDDLNDRLQALIQKKMQGLPLKTAPAADGNDTSLTMQPVLEHLRGCNFDLEKPKLLEKYFGGEEIVYGTTLIDFWYNLRFLHHHYKGSIDDFKKKWSANVECYAKAYEKANPDDRRRFFGLNLKGLLSQDDLLNFPRL